VGNTTSPRGIVLNGESSLLTIASERQTWDSREGKLPSQVVTLLDGLLQRKTPHLAITTQLMTLVEMS
jgi:hypothetical protein